MPQLIDLTRERYGMLTVTHRAPNQKKKTVWYCECDCGGETKVIACHLRSGAIRSCGCLGGTYKHGESDIHNRTPEYQAWLNMKRRCYNPNDDRYESYGGSGVKVCEQWKDDYRAFLADMGRRPSPDHSLERLNVYGDYEPSNCTWILNAEQQRNQRKTKLTPEGVELIRDWLDKGFTQQAIADTLNVQQTTVSQVKLQKIWRTEQEGQA